MNIVCTIKAIQSAGDGKAVATIVLNPVWGDGQFDTTIPENNIKGGQNYSIDGKEVHVGDGLLVSISKFEGADQ